jgi:hypothetical protein
MADFCPRCGSDDLVHEYRPLAGIIDVICKRCRHNLRIIPIKESAERFRDVREENKVVEGIDYAYVR